MAGEEQQLSLKLPYSYAIIQALSKKPMSNKKIPNFSTISTLIDRLSIENVKLAHFQNILDHDQPAFDIRHRLLGQVSTQALIISALKEELTRYLIDVFTSREYSYYSEERTFE